MKAKVNSEEELHQMAADLFHVLVNLRHYTKRWKEHYGANNNNVKIMWEEKADLLIEKLIYNERETNEEDKESSRIAYNGEAKKGNGESLQKT
jgi:inactivated superfamily I helicase